MISENMARLRLDEAKLTPDAWDLTLLRQTDEERKYSDRKNAAQQNPMHRLGPKASFQLGPPSIL